MESYRCIRDYVMNDDEGIAFVKGKVYHFSLDNDDIDGFNFVTKTNELGYSSHSLSTYDLLGYFKHINQFKFGR